MLNEAEERDLKEEVRLRVSLILRGDFKRDLKKQLKGGGVRAMPCRGI